MASLLCLAHFCEIHGPSIIMTTQQIPCSARDSALHFRSSAQKRRSDSADSADLFAGDFSSSFSSDSPPTGPGGLQITAGQLDDARTLEDARSRAEKPRTQKVQGQKMQTEKSLPLSSPQRLVPQRTDATCESCLLLLPSALNSRSQVLQTCINNRLFQSSRHPESQERFHALRKCCIRALSSEIIPARKGGIFFGDQSSGYTTAYVFVLPDRLARGGIRYYALICLRESEEESVLRFESTVEELAIIADFVTQQVTETSNRKTAEKESRAESGSGLLSTSPDDFLRSREGIGTARNLVDLSGNPDTFLMIHLCFARMLNHWNMVSSLPSISTPESRPSTESDSSIKG